MVEQAHYTMNKWNRKTGNVESWWTGEFKLKKRHLDFIVFS